LVFLAPVIITDIITVVMTVPKDDKNCVRETVALFGQLGYPFPKNCAFSTHSLISVYMGTQSNVLMLSLSWKGQEGLNSGLDLHVMVSPLDTPAPE
jgi:hypothetical protein